MINLSQEQQALVEQHYGRVRGHVQQWLRRTPGRLQRREREDLLQEAMVGLVYAAANYRTGRHGPFMPYALTYVRGAICRYLTRQMEGLALQPAEARRLVELRKQVRHQGAADPQTVAGAKLPRFKSVDQCESLLTTQAVRQARQQARKQECRDERAAGVSSQPIGWSQQALRERYVRAVRRAMAKLMPVYADQVDGVALLRAVVEERMLVPDERYRISRRQLSIRFGCSARRVWRYETRLFTMVRDALAAEAIRSQPAETLVRRAVDLREAFLAAVDYRSPAGSGSAGLLETATSRG